MKTGDKVALRMGLTLFAPQQASAPRTISGRKEFAKGDVFELVSISGEQATVKDEAGNFWQVLVEFLGLAQEIAHVDQNTTIGEGLTILQSIGNFFANLFKRKKKK